MENNEIVGDFRKKQEEIIQKKDKLSFKTIKALL